MKRMIFGMLCAFIGWVVGTQFNCTFGYVGVATGFLLGLVFNDTEKTKLFFSNTSKKIGSYDFDWYGFRTYVLILLYSFVLFLSWEALPVWLAIRYSSGTPFIVSVFIVSNAMVGIIAFCYFLVMVKEGWKARKDIFHLDHVSSSSASALFCLNPLSCSIIFYLVVVPFLLSFLPPWSVFIGALRGMCKIVFVAFVKLIAREKTLTFAVCIAVGSGIGTLLGNEMVCGLVSALIAATLVSFSERMCKECIKEPPLPF